MFVCLIFFNEYFYSLYRFAYQITYLFMAFILIDFYSPCYPLFNTIDVSKKLTFFCKKNYDIFKNVTKIRKKTLRVTKKT